MSKTLKQIGDNISVMARVKTPSAYFGGTDRNSRGIFLAIEQAIEEILRAQDWTQLSVQWEFGVPQGIGKIGLPNATDALPTFDHLNDLTPWSKDQNRPLIGPVTRDEWNAIEAWMVSPRFTTFMLMNKSVTDVRDYLQTFGVFGDEIGKTENCILWYQTLDHAVYTQGDPPATRYFESDQQFSLLDDDLIEIGGLAKFLRIIGRNYQDEMSDFHDLLAERVGRDEGSRVVSLETYPGIDWRYESTRYRDRHGWCVNTGRNIIP